MSLIERALTKIREAAEVGDAPATAAVSEASSASGRVPLASSKPSLPALPPFPRVADSPALILSDAVLSGAGLLAPPDQLRQVTAEYRHVKRRLLSEIQSGAVSRMMLIASALPGEGKSFSSANLAFSLALEPDYTVLLIDADVIKPNLSRTFGLADQPGLMDAASDSTVDVESLVRTTNIEGLSFLPAGRTNPNATEHFASMRMQAIIAQLMAVPNRLLVVDSLPLLLTTEARALAPLAGQVLLVVRAESTPQQAILEAISLLGDETDVKLLLNAAVRTRALEYFGYGYGYDYSYGERTDPRESRAETSR